MPALAQVAASLAAFPALYAGSLALFPNQLSPLYPKRRAWVLTLFSSAFLTLGSCAFVYDFARSGANVKLFRQLALSDSGRVDLAETMCSVFLAFLIWDTALGYRNETINLLTGYVHHGVYSLVILYALVSNQAFIFSLFAFLELPTFILAISTIVPEWRNDRLFAGVFGLTRVAQHSWMLVVFAREAMRADAVVGGGVIVLLSLALAMHIHWFSNNLKGMLARHRLSSAPPSPFPTPRTSATVPAATPSTLLASPEPEDLLGTPEGSEGSEGEDEEREAVKTPFDGPRLALERKGSSRSIPEIII